MKRQIRKALCLALASTFILASSCSLNRKDKEKEKDDDSDQAAEDVIDAASGFCGALSSGRSKKILKYVSEDADTDLASRIDERDDISEAVIEKMLSTITFEIDEDSAEGDEDDEEGSVDVVITMIDLDSDARDPENYDNVGEFEDKLDRIDDTREYEYTLDLVLEDGKWVIDADSAEDVIDDIWKYLESTSDLCIGLDEIMRETETVPSTSGTTEDNDLPDPDSDLYDAADVLDGFMWYFDIDENGTFINTEYIDVALTFTCYYDEVDLSGVWYQVVSDGSVLYTSSKGEYEAFFCEYNGAPADAHGLIETGEYTFTFYNGEEELTSATAKVTLDISDKKLKDVIDLSFDEGFKYYDKDVEALAEQTGFFNYDVEATTDFIEGNVFPEGYSEPVELTALLKDGVKESDIPEMYYAFYKLDGTDYGDIDVADFEIFDVQGELYTYTEGTFMEFYYGYPYEPCYLLVLVSRTPDLETPVLAGICKVTPEFDDYE
ncbi:MAG: hypothetical protein IKN14_05170 [Clostridiales bacterium]|nr:hypothetical protein [Clostridiales bacterium]